MSAGSLLSHEEPSTGEVAVIRATAPMRSPWEIVTSYVLKLRLDRVSTTSTVAGPGLVGRRKLMATVRTARCSTSASVARTARAVR